LHPVRKIPAQVTHGKNRVLIETSSDNISGMMLVVLTTKSKSNKENLFFLFPDRRNSFDRLDDVVHQFGVHGLRFFE
jgi:predicted ATPase